MYQELKNSFWITLLATCVVLLIEGLVATAWLGSPVTAVLWSAVFALPAVLFLSIAIVFAPYAWLRWAIVALQALAIYAQYTFASFYGRYLQSGEFHLLAANSAAELFESTRLYFSLSATALACAPALVYVAVAFHIKPTTRRKRVTIGALAASTAWVASVGSYATAQPIAAPEIALFATNLHIFKEWLVEKRRKPLVRELPPQPDGRRSDFDIIYLIGESLRADRFPPHQAIRRVTPFLSQTSLPHVSFSNVTSHGDCTGRSVPYLMAAPQQPLHLELYQRPTLFSYAKRANYRTAFVYANENDWSEFIDSNIDILKRNAEYAAGSDRWTYKNDDKMIGTVAEIANAPGPQFIVVETYTSHWPYGDRYRSCNACRVFRPDNVGVPVPFSSEYRTQIVNSYDNAMVYFDDFFRKLMSSLRKPTLVIFTSDHGESLGEKKMWGHCSGASEQFFVPLTLLATDADTARRANLESLRSHADSAVSHSNIFSSILGYMGYRSDSLKWRYEPGILEIPSAGVVDRTVLISEIGTGGDEVRFAHVDTAGRISRVETVKPTH